MQKLKLTLAAALLPLVVLLLFVVVEHYSHRSEEPQADRREVTSAKNLPAVAKAADPAKASKKGLSVGLVKAPEGAAGGRITQRIPIRQASARTAAPVPDRRNAFLTGPTAGDPLDIALDYVRAEENRAEFRPEDFANPKVSSRYETRHNGVTHIYLRQQHRGIEVYNGDLSVNLMPDGAIINLHNGFVPDLASGINRSDPLLTAEQAIGSAAKHYRQPITGPLAALPVPEPDAVAQKQLFSEAGLSLDPIPAKLVYVALADDTTRLAWNTVIRFDDGRRWLDLNIDAETGNVLSEANWIASTNYHVFPQPVETPNHGSRSIEADPDDPTASPFGWHDTDGVAGAEFTDTRGNNVNAQEDADDNDNDNGGARPDGGAGLDFNFPLDLADPPRAYQEAVTSNLFYWNNVIHDIFWHYGFDEPSGNFQENNYGNGGSGSDPVEADSRDGSGTNSANFGTPPDGSSPRMQMFVWTSATPSRDSSLDSGIIIHEYGHGISNRLTGGPANSSALNAAQSSGLGEGWSDWLGLALTAQAGDTATAGRGVGTYVLGQPITGAGIRPHRYTTNIAANPQTFGDLAGSELSVPHGVGSVWCTTLWEVYWALVRAHGFDADIYNGTGGNNIAIQLVIDGMKLQPATPTFLDARDAIIMADEVNNAGANFDLLWAAFAKRGMGADAYDGGDANSLEVVENFDIPDDLGVSPGRGDVFRPSGKPGGSFVPGSRTYTLTNDGDASLTRTVSKDANWLDLTASPGVLLAAASTTVDIDVNANADTLTAGFYTATITFTNETSGATLIRSVELTISDLADAVDEPSLTFSTSAAGTDTATLNLIIHDLGIAVDNPGVLLNSGGAAPWFSQSTVTNDGVDAAQSGAVDDDQHSWMETTVNGPDTISFYWKVDSETDFDYLRFLDEGVTQHSISGDVDWTQVTYTVPAGSHTLRWEYFKDHATVDGADAGWVDKLYLASVNSEPRIISDLTAHGPADVPFGYQIVATKSPTSYLSGALPTGLSLNATSGLISGTPSVVGTFPVDITATNAAGSDTTTLTLTIHDLGNAVDNPGVLLTLGGAAPWFSQSNVTNDGVDAAQSGAVDDNQKSWMETTVTGPSTLTFYWKVDSETNFDYLRFLDEGVIQHSISGNVDWTQVTYTVPAGSHTLRWEYSKDHATVDGADAGWVDELSLQGPPEITSNLNILAPTGEPFSYQIVATESPESYSSDPLPAGLLLNASTGLISGTPTTAGVYAVDITATNPTGADTATLNITLIDTASFPFLETFEGGAFDPVWSVTGTGVARTQVTEGNAPRAGTWHATMDTTSAADARNELTLAIDLTGQSFVALSFWAKDFGGDPDGPPASPFVGGADFDGVAISSDGINWYEVQPLRTEIGAAYSKFVVDLDAAIADHGLAYNPTFRIRFNHFDGLTIPSGGFAFDDIAVGVFAPEIAVEDGAANDLEDGVSVIFFADVDIGESEQHTFTIHNAGTEALTGLAATIGGPHAGEFTAPALASSTLAPGASASLNVSFARTVTGLRSATLAITSNDADENPFDIALSSAPLAPTTLGSFADEHGLIGDSRLASGNEDGDPYTLLEEYAYNLDPNVNDGGIMEPGGDFGLPLIRVVDGRLQVEYLRLRSDPDLSYTVEFGSELTEDPPDGFLPATEPETVTRATAGFHRVIVRDSVGSATHPARFGRVRLSYPSSP